MIDPVKARQIPLAERLDPAHTALVVIDVQNDFAAAAGGCGRAGDDVSAAPAMLGRLALLIESARAAGAFVVHVRAIYDDIVLSPVLAEQYQRRGFVDGLCLTGTNGAEFVAGITVRDHPGEALVTKHRYSPFWGTDIDLLLRSNGIATVVLAGIATEVCVESTARDAFFRDYAVVEAADCTSGLGLERHLASQAMVARSFGQVLDSTAIRSVWDGAPPGPRGWDAESKAARLLGTLEERVAPHHTALVLIDLQNDFCSARGAAGRRGERIEMIGAALDRCRSLLESARRAGALVIHVRAEYGPLYRHTGAARRIASAGSREGAVWSASAAEALPGPAAGGGDEICLPGTWGARPVDGFEERENEPVVVKHRFSAFVDTSLELLLRSNRIRTVVIGGVATNCCVESTARDACMRDFYVVVAEDGVAVKDANRDLHTASLESLRLYFGLVTPARRILEVWEGAGHRHPIRAGA